MTAFKEFLLTSTTDTPMMFFLKDFLAILGPLYISVYILESAQLLQMKN